MRSFFAPRQPVPEDCIPSGDQESETTKDYSPMDLVMFSSDDDSEWSGIGIESGDEADDEDNDEELRLHNSPAGRRHRRVPESVAATFDA